MSGISDERALWLGRFVFPHEASLRVWLSRRPLGELDVDDVVQEAYAKLIILPTITAIRDPRSYLFQVAKSVVADHLRRRKVVTITTSEIDILELPAPEPSIDIQVSDREELRRLGEAIAALPEPTRTIFVLRRVEQLPQRAIADRLRMPESTVEKHISRALVRVSNFLGRGGRGTFGASRRRDTAAWFEDETGEGTGN